MHKQFYNQLKEYNTQFAFQNPNLPKWFFQYTEPEPPKYWTTVCNLLRNEKKTFSIVEIGAGFGDVTVLLYHLGFQKIFSFETETNQCEFIRNKVDNLLNTNAIVLNQSYPQQLNFTPDIVLMVNCVYADSIANKEEYLLQIKDFCYKNGTPKIFILEVIDASYRETNYIFPEYVRVSEEEIQSLFPLSKITSFSTYNYPFNKVSKTLYSICISQ